MIRSENSLKSMSRIHNLYTHLITNRRPDVDGWLEAYTAFTRDVTKVRAALKQGHRIQDPTTYGETAFKGEKDPWQAFAKRLLADISNGVASSGQSILSKENLPRYIAAEDFVSALTGLIMEPDKSSFVSFDAAWERVRQTCGANRNPLLINRTLSACTRAVTSTVNAPDFETVYEWLVGEGILSRHADPQADWYDKNVQLMTFLGQAFAEELASGETSEELLSIFVWHLFENISKPFSLKKQVIKYGAPGTGKTYSAVRDTRLLFNIWKEEYGAAGSGNYEDHSALVQFHPSFGYEDFMEGLRPVLDKDGKAQLTLQNGAFKQACIKAAAWERDVSALPGCGRELAENWESLMIRDLIPHSAHLPAQHWQPVLSLPHPDKRVADAIPPYFFIIDEINRAELSRVLGELMFSLEYRGIKGAISTQYAALNTLETGLLATGGSWKFFIPHNLFLIGTMNTIDRSVESFDLALRRRFRWERADPDISALRYHLKQRDPKPGSAGSRWAGLADDLESLNRRIREVDILGSDYEIGHAYLMDLRYPPTITQSAVREKVWEDAIRPLLEEYLRGSGRGDALLPEFRKAFGVA